MKTLGPVSFVLVAGVAITVSAQPWFAGGYSHASTVEEGAARGLADVVRSAGAANLMNSEAAKNYEDARKKYIENRLQATETYFQMRRVNREARAAERPPRPAQEQLIRYSKSQLPQRLGPTAIDPLTGRITWPKILTMQPYEASRKSLEDLFRQRAENAYLTPEQFLEVKEETAALRDELQRHVNDYPSADSIAARKFIEGLAYEANMKPG